MSASLLLSNLLFYSAQIGVIIASAALLAWIFRVHSPAARLGYWQAVLAACVLLPLVEPFRPLELAPAVFSSTTAVVTVRPPAPATFTMPPMPVVLLWLLSGGAIARIVWLAIGFVRLRHYRLHSKPLRVAIDLPPGLLTTPQVLVSPHVSGPATFGLLRPVILLQEEFVAAPQESQRAILCHELIHVRRRDWLFTLAEELVRATLWFHPAIWWLLGHVQLAREQTVDREVIRLTNAREAYLETLLAAAVSRSQLDLAPAPLFLRNRHFAERVAAILKETTMSTQRLILFLSASFALLAAAGTLAVSQFPLRAQTDSNGLKVLHQTAPRYPLDAKLKKIEGPVVLEITVNNKGDVSDARVLTGPEELRRAALESVLSWHYSTTGAQFPATLRVTVDFKLSKETGVPDDPARAIARLEQAREVVFRDNRMGTLKRIDLNSLPANLREEIARKLPVREGDQIDMQTLNRIREAVREVDEHAQAGVMPAGDGVTLRVAVAGSEERTASAEPPPAQPGQIRVGGNVQAARLRNRVPPAYPPVAKQARIQGAVRLSVIIAKDGTVKNITALSGHPQLVPAAMEAVRNWTYEPTLLNGEPAEVITVVDVNFTLLE
ncbi:MAG: M56 family metallopeptidase [Bryobacteraceae bacterium]